MFKETDIRPDELIENQAQYIEIDRNKLLVNKNDFVEICCPACDSSKFEQTFIKNGFVYVTCLDCKTLYINPRPTAEILGKFYSESVVYEYWNKYVYPASDKARREFIFRPRLQTIISICKKYGFVDPTLVEIGAGYGTFCDEANLSGFYKNVIAIEPTKDGAESCRKKNINVIEQQIENVVLDSDSVDVMVSFKLSSIYFRQKIY